MSPVIAWKKTNVCSRKMAVGGTNGSRIWTGVTQVILNLLAFEDSLPDSVQAMTRVHSNLIPDDLEVEGEMQISIGLRAQIGPTLVGRPHLWPH